MSIVRHHKALAPLVPCNLHLPLFEEVTLHIKLSLYFHNIIEFLGSILSNQALGKHNPPLIMGFHHSWGALMLCDVEYRQATMIY